jgi:hypothetical protein
MGYALSGTRERKDREMSKEEKDNVLVGLWHCVLVVLVAITLYLLSTKGYIEPKEEVPATTEQETYTFIGTADRGDVI